MGSTSQSRQPSGFRSPNSTLLPDGVQKGDIVSSLHHADALAFLSCLQLADSFFPSGLYTLSHGLETCVQLGQVDGSTLSALLAEHLQAGFGASDSVALACAHRAGEQARILEAIRADRRLTSVKLARETRDAGRRRALARQADVLTEVAARSIHSPHDREVIEARRRRALAQLGTGAS